MRPGTSEFEGTKSWVVESWQAVDDRTEEYIDRYVHQNIDPHSQKKENCSGQHGHYPHNLSFHNSHTNIQKNTAVDISKVFNLSHK
jgi:hypothetical protein